MNHFSAINAEQNSQKASTQSAAHEAKLSAAENVQPNLAKKHLIMDEITRWFVSGLYNIPETEHLYLRI